jgi:hypothetical protein
MWRLSPCVNFKVVDIKRLHQTLRQAQGENPIKPHTELVEASLTNECPQPYYLFFLFYILQL